MSALTPFNPTQSYTTVTDIDGDIFAFQNGLYYDKQGNTLSTLPSSRNGFAPVSAQAQAYLGLVGSRGGLAGAINGAMYQSMSRSKHIAMDNITAPQIGWYNGFVVSPGVETPANGPGTLQMSIEYPVGTITMATYSGQTTGTVAAGAVLFTDPIKLPVTIPKGAAFYVRIFQNNPTGFIYYTRYGLNNVITGVPSSGEWITYGTSTPNLVNSATNVTNQNATVCITPAAIIGMTTRPSVFIAGDSRCGQNLLKDFGTLGATNPLGIVGPNGYGGVGEVERGVVKNYATFQAACNTETMANALTANYTNRLSFAKYCSHIICEYGINDIVLNSTSAAAMVTLVSSFAALFGGKPFWQTTLTPWVNDTSTPSVFVGNIAGTALTSGTVTSGTITIGQVLSGGTVTPGTYIVSGSGTAWVVSQSQTVTGSPTLTGASSYQTLATQTPVAQNAVRVAYNNIIRAGLPAPVSGYIESADQVESSRDSGLWKVNGIAYAYTSDGVHGNAAGNYLIEQSGAYNNLPFE